MFLLFEIPSVIAKLNIFCCTVLFTLDLRYPEEMDVVEYIEDGCRNSLITTWILWFGIIFCAMKNFANCKNVSCRFCNELSDFNRH